MRPVNLIPENDRRGSASAARGGPLAYILVGALVVLLAGVTLLVTTNNQISASKAEASELSAEIASVEARVSQLAAYTQLREVHQERVETVTGLAESRFDWERVLREVSLILPHDVWLTNLSGSVTPEVSVNGSAGVGLRASVPGPALEIVGCASGQDAVAGFVTALKDIEGVTRVAMQYSNLPEGEGGSSSGEGGEQSANCQTRNFIAQFQLVAAFDAAPVSTLTSATEVEGG